MFCLFSTTDGKFCSQALDHQPQQFQLPRVLRAGGEQIDPGGVDGTVSQYICQLDDIPGGLVKCDGKEMAIPTPLPQSILCRPI